MSLFLSAIRYIYFDFDNVLARRVESRMQLVARLLPIADPVAFREYYFRGFMADRALAREYFALRSVEAEASFYEKLFSLYLRQQGNSVSRLQLQAAVTAFIHVPFQVPDGVIAGLTALQRRYTLGVLTNGLPSRHRELSDSGLAPFFHEVLISCDYGIEKPDPKLYEVALKAAGQPAAQVALVDDDPINLRGATQFGFGQSLLFTPEFWRQVPLAVK